jgi:alpha-2-macroglobulin
LRKLNSEKVLPEGIYLSPMPDHLRLKTDGRELQIYGDFDKQDHWTLEVKSPFASADDRVLTERMSEQLIFTHLDPSIGLPSTEEAQLAAGTRQYRMETVNLKDVHVRAKQLSGLDLVRALQGYRHYTGNGPNGTTVKPTAPLPYELIAGATVIDQTLPLSDVIDTSKTVTLAWDELLPNAAKHTAYFLEATGTPLRVKPDSEDPPNPSAQAFIQLTDIGLAWKLTKTEARVYAFSCTTGEPLPAAKIEVYGEDAKLLQTLSTDATGLATILRNDLTRHLRAALGDDQYVAKFDNEMPTVSLWRFPVRYSWDAQPDEQRRVMIFTDRSLYQPGEMVRLKGIIRTQRGNAIEASDAAAPRLVIVDPAEKEIFSRDLKLSANGSFDLEFPASKETTGHYGIRLKYPDEIARAEALGDDAWEAKEKIMANAQFEFEYRVEEFRRNAFELEQKFAATEPGSTKLGLDLSARYYQGQPVAAGSAHWYSRVEDVNLYPDNYRDYLFGSHRTEDWHYWYHYFSYRWDEETDRQTTTVNGETTLDDTGKGTFAVDLPQGDFPTAREVTISTEVSDANNQTLTASTTTTVHPSSVYVGVSRLDKLVRVGDHVALKIVAVDPDGKPSDAAVQVETVLTCQINEQSKTRNEDGATIVRNDAREEPLSTSTMTLKGEGTYDLAPTGVGLHFLTLKGKDAAGHPFATTTSYYVYGSNEYPWAYEDGMKIKLVSEKKSYKPGETARILVLSPIEGTALVTVERESVLRSFVIPLKADNPVIEIPLTDADAPNAFVSVLVVKGSQDSGRKFKEPQLRLGYCELTVEDRLNRLAVEVKAENSADTVQILTHGGLSLAAYRPGDEVVLSGTVTRADGTPVKGSEVTLYAEDEGTLAVMGYENPDPLGFFQNPRLLTVDSGTSLDQFIAEDPENQSFFNKGFFVGGGDDLAGNLADLLRKNFDPCATWAPSLVTDEQGHFRHSFKVPDTLTRYRVLAVASEGASRFGSVRTDFVVNKPLMLEPKATRFANVSDQLKPQVMVQNASPYTGVWKVSLIPGEATNAPVYRLLSENEVTVTLAPGASQTVPFEIAVESEGEAVLTFRAVPIMLDGKPPTTILANKMSDRVETRFPVSYPMPLIRQSKLVKLEKSGTGSELKSLLDPALLEGKGDLSLEFSRSLLLESGASIDYLLSYPHGCVEQTTSSLMPWFAVESLRPVVPRFANVSADQVKAAIQTGVDRLLSMQLPTGGFAYWPGGRERLDWATSYAGLGLVMAKESGAAVPDNTLELLGNDLIASLRGLSNIKSPAEMEIATRSLWVLARLGKPQTAYHNYLRDHLEAVPLRGRCFLALAMAANGEDKASALAVLNSNKPFKAKDDSWMPWNPDEALNLLAAATLAPQDPELGKAVDKLMRDRNPYGEWRTTWVNGWSLLALSAYAKTESTRDDTVAISLGNGQETTAIRLSSETPVASQSIKTGAGLKLSVKSDGIAMVRATLASKPAVAPLQPIAHNGLEITRFHERVKPDSTTEPLFKPAVGDLIKVSLRVTLPHDDSRYLVIEDPLPAIFETVNSDFDSQKAANGPTTSEGDWHISHSELRSDRAVFYLDRVPNSGTYTLTYLARCTVAGEATAPPAKVEWMYDPENFALSASRLFHSK